MTPLERKFSTGEVAELFQVNPETVRRWVKSGRLPAIEMPSGLLRFLESDVQAALQKPFVPESGTDLAPPSAAAAS
jgi:excisionase family DNA binding protein